MDSYKKRLKIKIRLLGACMFVVALLGTYDVFFVAPVIKYNPIFEYQCGVAAGLGILCSVLIIKYNRLLYDETKLQIQYNKENDERLKLIRAKAGFPMILMTSIIMIIAGILMGYYNFTVFQVLTVAAICQMIIACIVKLVYMKKI